MFGTPEGSVLGPVLFTVSTAPLQILTKKHCFQHHKSADDLQVYVTDSPNLPHARERTVKQLTDFIDDVVPWMISGKLKLNGMKTEFLVLLSPQQLKKYGRSENIAVDGAVIRPVMLVRNLGAWRPFRHPSLNGEPGYRYLQEVQLSPPSHCIHQSLHLEGCVSETGHCSGGLQLGLLQRSAATHHWISTKTLQVVHRRAARLVTLTAP